MRRRDASPLDLILGSELGRWVLAADADDPTGEGQMEVLPTEVLEMFDLVSWDTAFLAPAQAGGSR